MSTSLRARVECVNGGLFWNEPGLREIVRREMLAACRSIIRWVHDWEDRKPYTGEFDSHPLQVAFYKRQEFEDFRRTSSGIVREPELYAKLCAAARGWSIAEFVTAREHCGNHFYSKPTFLRPDQTIPVIREYRRALSSWNGCNPHDAPDIRENPTVAALLVPGRDSLPDHEGDCERPILRLIGFEEPDAKDWEADVVLNPARTRPTAIRFVEDKYGGLDDSTLRHYGDNFWRYNGSQFTLVDRVRLFDEVSEYLTGAKMENSKGELLNFPANPKTRDDAVKSITEIVHIDDSQPSPCWVNRPLGYPADGLIPMKTGIFHLPTRTMLPATPRYFATNALAFDYDPAAPSPAEWLAFLGDLFGDDGESIRLLQEYIGYLLSGRTDLHKFLFIVGPKRSGKGTISRIITALVGDHNACGPTAGTLGGEFGLETLIGASLATVNDARFDGKQTQVVERILSIVGEDRIDINRKNRPVISVRLGVRFVMASNEVPKMLDPSGALAGRMLILKLSNSYYGKERIDLGDALLKELPGILRWALDGLDRLNARGRFVQPASSFETLEQVEEMLSPITAFVRDHCVVGAGESVATARLYEIYTGWCKGEGHHVTSKSVFGRDIIAATTHLGVKPSRPGGVRSLDGIGIRYAVPSA